MRVLILTQYYLPENPPGAHRLSSLANSLVREGHSVEVMTAWPNYPKLQPYDGYKVKWHKVEDDNGVRIHRCYIYLNPKKKIFHRLLASLTFLFSTIVNGISKINKPDIIICLSPPIFTCFAGVFLKWRYRSQLILNIADLWPESGVKLGVLKNKTLIDVASWFEVFFYNQADAIACQTQGILKNIEPRTKTRKLYWFRNGVDFDYYNSLSIDNELLSKLREIRAEFVIVYTGLIGYAQGMEVLADAIKKISGKISVACLMVGEGPRLDYFMNKVEELGLTNFHFFGNQPKTLMATFMHRADVSIVPLIKSDLYLGALPSKIFDSFAVRRTVLLGVAGEAKEIFVDRNNCAYFYEPGDADSLADLILEVYNAKSELIEKGQRGYELMMSEFNRKTINKNFIGFLNEVFQSKN